MSISKNSFLKFTEIFEKIAHNIRAVYGSMDR